MDRKEELRKAYVATLNTLIPELTPWIHERLARGQNAFQTLNEFKIALGAPPPVEVLQILGQARSTGPMTLDLSSVTHDRLVEEIARRLRETPRAAASVKNATPKAAKGPSFAPQIAAQMVQQAPPPTQEIDLTDSAP